MLICVVCSALVWEFCETQGNWMRSREWKWIKLLGNWHWTVISVSCQALFFLPTKNHWRNVYSFIKFNGWKSNKTCHKFRLSLRAKLSLGIRITAHRLAWPSHIYQRTNAWDGQGNRRWGEEKIEDLKKWRLLKLLQLNLHKLWPESSSFWFTGLLCGYANAPCVHLKMHKIYPKIAVH